MAAYNGVKARGKAAILGGFVADAATAPLHWIYDVTKVEELLSAKQKTSEPEFFDPPSCPFYQNQLGLQSPYGTEVLALLKSLSAKASFDPQHYAESIAETFTSEPTAYRNHSIKSAIDNLEAGKQGTECGDPEDFQANCLTKAAVIVAKYAGQPELGDIMEQAVRVQQNNDKAVNYGLSAARILERVILGESIQAALASVVAAGEVPPEVQALVEAALATLNTPLTVPTYEASPFMAPLLEKVMAAKDKLGPYTVAVWCNGPSCANPGAFTNSLICSLTSPSYVEGVRANMVAGGDNCSRSMFIGALLAAQGGLESIPVEWRNATKRYSEYEQLVDALLAN